MALERTLSIIKPDAIERNLIGEILRRIEGAEIRIIAAKMLRLDEVQVSYLYHEHRGKPFYRDLVRSMVSGPIMAQVLEGEDAISRYRRLIGNANPAEAVRGTIRADYAESICYNSVHGSSSPEAASRETKYLFLDSEIHFYA